jgi:hypothetical protein
MTDKRIQGMPAVLETPSFEKNEVWAKEIEILNGMTGLVDDGGDNERILSWDVEIKAVVKNANGTSK